MNPAQALLREVRNSRRHGEFAYIDVDLWDAIDEELERAGVTSPPTEQTTDHTDEPPPIGSVVKVQGKVVAWSAAGSAGGVLIRFPNGDTCWTRAPYAFDLEA